MYFKTLACALVAMIAPAIADESWLTNIDKAAEQAAKDNKAVFVEFTGSDWCGPCIHLKKTVFDSKEFEELADKTMVLVELDYPRTKEQSAEQKAYNQEMGKKYAISGYPTAILMDSKGTIFWKRVGGASAAEEYLQDLKKGLDAKDALFAKLEQANAASGIEKAKLLDAALKSMNADLRESNAKLVDEIITLDTEDTLGYAKKKADKEKVEKERSDFQTEMKTLAPLMEEKKYGEVLDKIAAYEKGRELSISMKQEIRFINMQLLMSSGEIDKALANMDEAIKLDPESKIGQMAKSAKKQITENREAIEKQLKESQKL